MISFIILILINLNIVFCSKKSFGKTLPVTLTGTTVLIYFS